MFVCSSVWEDVTLTGAGLAILFAMLAVMVIAVVAFNAVPRLVHKWEIAYTTRDLTYGAACLALAFALSWAGVKLPQRRHDNGCVACAYLYILLLLRFSQGHSRNRGVHAFAVRAVSQYSIAVVGVFRLHTAVFFRCAWRACFATSAKVRGVYQARQDGRRARREKLGQKVGVHRRRALGYFRGRNRAHDYSILLPNSVRHNEFRAVVRRRLFVRV